MPEAAFCILMALVEYVGYASTHQISAASGYDVTRYWYMIKRLEDRGCVFKPFNGGWIITERGKIAVAIEVGRRARAVSSGVPRKRTQAREFMLGGT